MTTMNPIGWPGWEKGVHWELGRNVFAKPRRSPVEFYDVSRPGKKMGAVLYFKASVERLIVNRVIA